MKLNRNFPLPFCGRDESRPYNKIYMLMCNSGILCTCPLYFSSDAMNFIYNKIYTSVCNSKIFCTFVL